MTDWRPLQPADVHDVLEDGLPPWLMPTVRRLLDSVHESKARYTDEMSPLIYEFDRLRRGTQPLGPEVSSLYLGSVIARRGDEQLALEIIDYLLHKGLLPAELIKTLFEQAGSKWTATAPGRRGGKAGLVERVPDGVRESAEAAMALPSSGSLLSEAWHAAFGRNPDPEEAYEKAIKAVEAAGVSVVSPNNTKATLGTMIINMRDQKDWRLPTSVPGREQGHDVVLKMAEALWNRQGSRHGGNDYVKPTQEQAEAALLLAVPLVHYFERGIVVRGAKWAQPKNLA